MPGVSILVPTYNRRAYLKECLDSLLTTTVPCEIIVSDNASSDGTPELLGTYDDPRIRYYRQETNIGSIANHNFLLSQASREYVCLFGDDDIALPGCFESKVAVLDNAPHIDGIYSLPMGLDEHGNLMVGNRVNGCPDSSYVNGRDDHIHLLINCCISWQTLVFRRKLYLEYGGFKHPELSAVDWDYLIELTQKYRFAYIRQPTVGIRLHSASHSNMVHINDGKMVKEALFIWRKWLLEQHEVPVITENTWNLMAQVLLQMVQKCWGPDEQRAQEWLAKFNALQHEYHVRMERRFYAKLSQWQPERPDVDADGLPVFRPGLTPLAVDTHKRGLFFHHPIWAEERWKQVIADYVQAFQPTDDVELILWLDPDQGITVEEASDRITRHVISLGLDPQQAADMQLLAEPLDLAGQARLYTAMHVIVPAGDPRQLDRGVKTGRMVMTQVGPTAWRRIAEILLGPLPDTNQSRLEYP